MAIVNSERQSTTRWQNNCDSTKAITITTAEWKKWQNTANKAGISGKRKKQKQNENKKPTLHFNNSTSCVHTVKCALNELDI